MEFSKIVTDFQNETQKIMTETTGIIKQANLAHAICNLYLGKLKKAFLSHPPKTKAEEIHFFKQIKPKVLSELLFYSEIRSFELAIANRSIKFKRKRIEKRLKFIDKFVLVHSEFRKYIALERSHLDKHYFTRNKSLENVLINFPTFYHDPDFDTSHDRLLACLWAANKMTEYLKNRLLSLDKKTGTMSFGHFSGLKWTASKIALAELIYALHYSNSIDHGESGINKIAKAFQVFFDFEIGEVYQIFSEIKMRQKSRTKFLDELTFALNSEIKKSEL